MDTALISRYLKSAALTEQAALNGAVTLWEALWQKTADLWDQLSESERGLVKVMR